jgi:hypothetical protein
MEYYVYRDPNDELIHWGVKGMKWGKRLYQRKDGSLTMLGKRRRNKQLDEARKKRQAILEAKKKRQKDIESGRIKSKNMTSEELEARINRLKLEQTYNELLSSQKASTNARSQKFVDKFLDSTVEKLADTVGADLVAQTVKVVLAKGINKAASKAFDTDQDVVFTNNKKK